jgi:hypothetical protein
MKTMALCRSLLVILTFTSSALAEEAPPVSAAHERTSPATDSAAYCDFVSGVARSESAVLVAPVAFGSVGAISGADATGGSSTLPPRGRVTAGLSYSASSLVRGLALDSRADAECQRYRAESEVHAFVAATVGGRRASALAAKLAVLQAAIPRAEVYVKAFQVGVAAAQNTVDDLQALEMRTDALRSASSDVRAELEATAGTVALPAQPLDGLLRNRDSAEIEASRQDARVRSTQGWDVALRGGYEQIFDVYSAVPLFGSVTVSVDLGTFFQGSEEKRAAAGRTAWRQREVEGVDQRALASLERLKGLHADEQQRLVETRALGAEMDARAQSVAAATGPRARAFAELVWFDQVKIKAEEAYLVAHLAELDRLLQLGESK